MPHTPEHEGNVTHGLTAGRDLGPTLPEFISTCWERQPAKLGGVLGISGVCFLITLAIVLKHRQEMMRMPIGLRRMYYCRIGLTPVALGATAYFALWSPASSSVSAMLQKGYEAVTLSTFGMLLYLLLWYESNALSSQVSPEDSKPEIVAKALAAQGPKKHWGAPPFGCCFRPCMPETNLTVKNLSVVFWFVRQYVVLTPTVGLLALVILTAFAQPVLVKGVKVMKIILLVSNLLCLYGLFVTYSSTHDLLHRWNTTRKFVAIKVVLILMVYQEMLLEYIGPLLLDSGKSCFLYVGFHREWEEVEIRFWANFLLTIEMVFMAVALRRAFPAEELREPIPEIHHSLLDMEMSRKITKDQLEDEDGVVESSDEEACTGAENIDFREPLLSRPTGRCSPGWWRLLRLQAVRVSRRGELRQ